MKDRIYAIMVAILLASNVAAGIVLNDISKRNRIEQAKECIPTITPTPTPDVERLQLIKENEKLRQEVKTLQVFKNDLEGFLKAQIRR